MAMKVEIYSKNDCPQCESVKRPLISRGVEYVETNRDEVDDPQSVTDFLKSRGIQEFPYVVVSELKDEEDFSFSGSAAKGNNAALIRKIIDIHMDEKADADSDTWDF